MPPELRLLVSRGLPFGEGHETSEQTVLRHGIDRSVIALWLGHESVETTQIYLHADLRQKKEAIAKVTPLDMPPGRFRPDDELLAFLEGL
jgi:integrase/recombinase XerD